MSQWSTMARRAGILLATATLAVAGGNAAAEDAFRNRAPTDEVIYFVLPDRFENGTPANDHGGLPGDRMQTGFDPTHKGFYHGGDLAGLTARLDYIQAMGATAIWLGPIYQNKPVQGGPGYESAGYHGYWITDFTRADPHFGTEAELRAFIDAAHGRGMKVYLDIITNHTADVIDFRECPRTACPYRSKADYPGKAYTPFIPAGEEKVKFPDWLNDVTLYHNRGSSTFEGESAQLGDFASLDDLDTENPRVVQGFIDIYGGWIDRYRIDGFRIDTAKHVNPEFWQAFAPAMLARAKAQGIPHFHIFGEVYTGDVDPLLTARWGHIAGLPSVLDFAFANAVKATVADGKGTDVLERLFDADVLYPGGEDYALQLPTFIGNHDMGRVGHFIRAGQPKAEADEQLARAKLAHAMLFLLRGIPTVYYGDEQGFAGRGGDQDSRQDMFPSLTKSYNEDTLIGTKATTAVSNFDMAHPLYVLVKQLSAARAQSAALRSGRQVTRFASPKPGLFAASRLDPATGREVLVVFNTSNQPLQANVVVDAKSARFRSLVGPCAGTVREPGSYRVVLPAFGFAACAATE